MEYGQKLRGQAYTVLQKMVQQTKPWIKSMTFCFKIDSKIGKDTMLLGLVHEIYKPLLGRFKDYIAMPSLICISPSHPIGHEGISFEYRLGRRNA